MKAQRRQSKNRPRFFYNFIGKEAPNKSIQSRPRIAARFFFGHLGAAADAGRSLRHDVAFYM